MEQEDVWFMRVCCERIVGLNLFARHIWVGLFGGMGWILL